MSKNKNLPDGHRVRYGYAQKGKYKGKLRSALVTVRKGDRIFFGLSKCNLKADKWNKIDAIDWAKSRADLAVKDGFSKIGDVSVHNSGLFGSVHCDDADQMIEYFRETTGFLPSAIQENLDIEKESEED